MALTVFVDFDGTVTRQDVGNAFFRRFGGAVCDAEVAEYHAGRISAQECFRRELAAVGKLNLREAEAFIAEQQIDSSFRDFVDFCAASGIGLWIVSDGLDFYIDRILHGNGIQGVPVFSNRLHLGPLSEDGGVLPTMEFPMPDAECTICACCKRNIMLTHAGDDDIIVYVGEGFSDRCPVRYADVVFAKDALQVYCQNENISYYLYTSFGDVQARLSELSARRRLRKRARAEVRRREVFAGEP
jgi:2-hydroxy-3-keto-5-methylthiopentenyl-1-phosphate phosphatase